MFKHLVVPLDGSRLAEAALPAAAYLAERLDASVTLLHIIERDAPQAVHGERHLKDPEEATAYLDAVAQRAFPAGLRVRRHVHADQTANVPRGIVAHGDELGPDLIIMCTHGRGGPGDWLFGSIAQQVVGHGVTPLLLIHPAESGPQPAFECRRLLVPLDGNPDHERSLPAAAGLARVCEGTIHMVLVVPTLGKLSGTQAATGILLPGTTRAMLELAEQDAESYLQRHAAELAGQGIAATVKVLRGDPVGAIADTARAVDADLLVLGTHGKAGTDAFWSGSLSPKLAGKLRLPLLLVPVGSRE